MNHHGLYVRFAAKSGKDEDVAKLLRAAQSMVARERRTTAWFALRFARHQFGIFDTFSSEADRAAHLAGPVAHVLRDMSSVLFTSPPEIHELDVLAEKLSAGTNGTDAKALLLTFRAKAGRERDVEDLLRNARVAVAAEPKTTAWFAVRLDSGEYGIFDTFPDDGGRFAHLTGQVPRELAKHALSLLGSVPDMDMVNVVAEKLPTAQAS
jgi:quinol monooxygenase YgiN